jgi:ribonuclease VapC
MIVDTSALVAITFKEKGYESLISKLIAAPASGIGTPTLTETGIVLASRLRRDPRDLLFRMLGEFEVTEVPFGEQHWRTSIDAFLKFGRGRHPAELNFGDCLSYAVARLADEPLLYVGDDFAATDLDAA